MFKEQLISTVCVIFEKKILKNKMTSILGSLYILEQTASKQCSVKPESAHLSYRFKGKIPENSSCLWNATAYRKDCPNDTYDMNITLFQNVRRKKSR